MLPRSTLSEVRSHQPRTKLLFFRIDESAISGTSSAGILEGTYDAVITKNGTGDYTITFNEASARVPIVIGAAPIGLADARYKIEAVDETSVQIIWEVGGTDTNADFHLTVAIFPDQTQR